VPCLAELLKLKHAMQTDDILSSVVKQKPTSHTDLGFQVNLR
jgi:hypothetical protein